MSEKPLIIETNLTFSRPLTLRTETHKVIIHHTASGDVTAARVHAWHLARRWAGIGYHYLIRRNGHIELGRPENTIGAHTAGENHNSIGVALTGNFENQIPTNLQLRSLHLLLMEIQGRFPRIMFFQHREFSATACPGSRFPWADVMRRIRIENLR